MVFDLFKVPFYRILECVTKNVFFSFFTFLPFFFFSVTNLVSANVGTGFQKR